jgi:hypothetical protein
MARAPTVDGNPLAPKFDPAAIGTTGLRQFGGYVNEEFLRELSGSNAARVYREMSDNDPAVGAVIFALSTLIRQIEWTVQAADDSPEAEAAKEFVEGVLDDMETPWTSVIDEVCSMFIYGFAPLEILWKRRSGLKPSDPTHRSAYTDGKIGIRALPLRAQNTVFRWEFDPEDGKPVGMYQQPWSGPQVFIPAGKLLLFRTTDTRNNPEGRSILRSAYRPWLFKKRIEEIEAVGVERDLAGLPVAYIPAQYLSATADPADRAVANEFKTLIRSIKRDTHEGILLPSIRDKHGQLAFEIKLLSTGGARTFNTTEIIDRYNKAIATSVLADFIFLGQSAVGSFALSSDKTALFATAVGAFTTAIANTLNRDLLPRLWELNGMDPEFMPMLVPGDVEKPDLASLSDYVSKLASAGATMFPDRELENALRRAANLPLAPEDGEMMDSPDMEDPEAEEPEGPASEEPVGAEREAGEDEDE